MNGSDVSATKTTLAELARLGLKLGATAFGGPAAHISMLHREVVSGKGWFTEEEYLDMLSATHLIPGPNSTEMILHVGHQRAGWKGLLVAGGCFIAPAFAIVLILAWVYVEYGTIPAAQGLLWGIKPVVFALILQAVWKLGRKAITSRLLATAGILVFIGFTAGVNEILLMLLAGLLVLGWKRGFSFIGAKKAWLGIGLPPTSWMGLPEKPGILFGWEIGPWTGFLGTAGIVTTTVTYSGLFLVFLKVGAVLYGSGYVLIAFLQADLVEGLRWITQKQLIDAVAVGQITPGPLFTTATFIGYVVAGVPGAVLATIGIFLPAFIFVAISSPLIPKIRRSSWAGHLLDGINAASVGLMAGVLWPIGSTISVDVWSVLLLMVAAILLWRTRINAIWLVVGSALIGVFSAHSSFLG